MLKGMGENIESVEPHILRAMGSISSPPAPLSFCQQWHLFISCLQLVNQDRIPYLSESVWDPLKNKIMFIWNYFFIVEQWQNSHTSPFKPGTLSHKTSIQKHLKKTSIVYGFLSMSFLPRIAATSYLIVSVKHVLLYRLSVEIHFNNTLFAVLPVLLIFLMDRAEFFWCNTLCTQNNLNLPRWN